MLGLSTQNTLMLIGSVVSEHVFIGPYPFQDLIFYLLHVVLQTANDIFGAGGVLLFLGFAGSQYNIGQGWAFSVCTSSG